MADEKIAPETRLSIPVDGSMSIFDSLRGGCMTL